MGGAALAACRLLFAQGPLTPQERLAVTIALAALAVLLCAPAVGSAYTISQLRDALLLALFALSLDYLWGRAHTLVLGQALFFGVGAYAMAIATTKLGWSTGAGIGLGIAVAVALAISSGYFLLFAGVRLHFFAILTMAMSLIAYQVIVSWSSVTGGDVGILGIPPITIDLFGIVYSTADETAAYYGALAVTSLMLLALWLACRGPYGHVLDAIGTNEMRARTLGYNTSLHLLIAFAVAAAIAALAGALYAAASGVVAPDLLGVLPSTEVMVWVAIGGRGTLIGPLLATLLVTQFGHAVSSYSTSLWPLVLGSLFVLVVFAIPDGLAALVRTAWQRLRNRRPQEAIP
ncbi:MAG TPA: branched-chain amino acid ABC transporter permease [Vineibacter sp.]|nr:branched-chain amino acid ABC transporter permease [Vineibacter sp.]